MNVNICSKPEHFDPLNGSEQNTFSSFQKKEKKEEYWMRTQTVAPWLFLFQRVLHSLNRHSYNKQWKVYELYSRSGSKFNIFSCYTIAFAYKHTQKIVNNGNDAIDTRKSCNNIEIFLISIGILHYNGIHCYKILCSKSDNLTQLNVRLPIITIIMNKKTFDCIKNSNE